MDHKIVYLLFMICFVNAALTETEKTDSSKELSSRNRRSVFSLAAMVKFATNRNPKDYLGYGRYCGLGDIGGPPVDQIDVCCKYHDECWITAMEAKCFLPHFVHYKFTTNFGDIRCYDDPRSCKRRLCECDRVFAWCISDKVYNRKFKTRKL